MGGFRLAVGGGGHEEAQVGQVAAGVVWTHGAQGHGAQALLPGDFQGADYVGRVAGAAYGDEQVAFAAVPFQGFGEDVGVAEVVADGGEQRGVGEDLGADPGVFRQVGGEMTGHGRAGPVAREVGRAAVGSDGDGPLSPQGEGSLDVHGDAPACFGLDAGEIVGQQRREVIPVRHSFAPSAGDRLGRLKKNVSGRVPRR